MYTRNEYLDRITPFIGKPVINYPKYLITLDRHFGNDIHGIHRLHLLDFLLRND